MKTLLLELLANFWILLSSVSAFILIGVVIAGVLKFLLPDAFIKKHLGSRSFVANIKAAVLGIPLPLCSCSVIPFVSALKKSGASNSAIQTFLISTPITGVDSIMATYGVFGWAFTIYRVLTSLAISLLAGLLTLFFDRQTKPKVQNELNKSTKQKECASAVGGIKFKPVEGISSVRSATSPLHAPSNANVALQTIGVVKQEDTMHFLQKILAYAFDDILKDISRSLLIGVVIGAIIVTFMPDNMAEYISSNVLINYSLVLLISVPLYVCATSSIPLGVSLLAVGFSPGAAFIFLTAGPATNTVTISVVLKTLGKLSLMIYLLSVILGSLFFGLLFDHFFPIDMLNIFSYHEHKESSGFFANVSSVLLLYFTIRYSLNRNSQFFKNNRCCTNDNDSCCSRN